MREGSPLKGTAGYAEEANDLHVRYESFGFEDAHEAILKFLPGTPVHALDIGAGTERDAAYLASKGHEVIAVEPTEALRVPASELHPSSAIQWVDDGLPGLEKTVSRELRFELILMSAVWMHLDAAERRQAMPVVASLLGTDGIVIMTLRHGPVPPGRRMFPVVAAETVRLAETEGLTAIFNCHAESRQEANRHAGVGWTTLVFKRHR